VKSFITDKRFWIGIVVGLVIGIGAGSTPPSEDPAPTTAQNSEVEQEEEEETEDVSCADLVPADAENYDAEYGTCIADPEAYEYVEPEPDPEPKGKFGLASCNLGSPDGLIGSTEVDNTGEVPLTARVTFKWQLGDGSFIEAEPKKTSVRVGGSKLVFFSAPADIDTQLSFQDHPGYFKGPNNCKTSATIME
jgi:hypothetical protein